MDIGHCIIPFNFSTFNLKITKLTIRNLLLLIILYTSNNIYAQNPPDNAKLNYTQVMFEYPNVKFAAYYKIQIAKDTTAKVFDKFILIEQTDSTTATLINGLKFGSKYQWRSIAFNKKGNIIDTSKIFFFQTLTSNYLDTNIFRYRINKKEINDGLIFLDTSSVAINRDGKPVWFLPSDVTAMDIKMTVSGNITYIGVSNGGNKIDINGKQIWHTPIGGNTVSGDFSENFHHAFKKLPDNHYMILGAKFEKPKHKIDADKICFPLLIEYDADGKIIWSWDSEKYISDTDLYYSPNSKYKYINNNGNKYYDPLHANGFIYDDKNQIVYISFAWASRIVKIDMKTGNILTSFGEKAPSGTVKYGNRFFSYQHSPLLLPDSNIAVFDNNLKFSKKFRTSSVVVFSQPTSKEDTSKVVWRFKFNFDSLTGGYSYARGSIKYLDNKDFLVDMGQPFGRIFQVTPDKKIVWDCFPETFSATDNKWKPSCSYRASYTKTLYPIYFTLNNSLNPDSLKHRKNIKISFDINNEGHSTDSYTIDYLIDTIEYKTIKTEDVFTAKSKNIKLKIKDIKPENKQITVIVSSNTNQRFIKKHTYIIK